MAGKSIIGQYGLIPEDVYLRRSERTNLYEDPDLIETYQRQNLKNYKCDQPLFESDQNRVCSESAALINLRHGGYRSNEEPFIDSVFLNFDHFSKDPRSIMPDPNFRMAVDHQYKRAGLYNFKDDSCPEVQELMINPLDMQELKTNAFYTTKDYKKIFETSLDSRSTKSAGPTLINIDSNFCKNVEFMDHDDKNILDLNATTCKNRNDFTTNLSNNTQIGWWTDIDARFQISNYGHIRPTKNISEDWHRVHREVKPDQMIGVSREGINLNRDIALMMINFQHRKDMLHNVGRNINFGMGTEATQRARKATAKDIRNLITRSAAKLAHQQYEEGDEYQQTGIVPKIDLNPGAKIIINPQIIDFVASVLKNRTAAPRDTDDLRAMIEQTALEQGIYLYDHTNQQRAPVKSDIDTFAVQRETVQTGLPGQEFKPKDYSALRPPPAIYDRSNQAMEAYKTKSTETQNKQMQQLYDAQTVTGFSGDNENPELEGLTKERFTRGLGTKNLRTALESDGARHTEMMDMEARNH